jgi:FkbM family methyltransferase
VASPKLRFAGHQLLDAFAAAYPEAFFIEIGSNDGQRDSYLRPHILASRWRGVMVEPVPYLFERLQHNYAGVGRVALENVAIADRDAELPFFHLAEADAGEPLPDWYSEIGSFSREFVLGHRDEIPDIEQRLVETSVPCLTFESLCRKHGVEALDLVLIDAEGHDAEIVDGIDLAARHPRLLVFEHYHLPETRRAECVQRLGEAGYETLAEGFNTWCLDPGAAPELAATWRAIEPVIPAATAAAPPPVLPPGEHSSR